MTIKARFCSIFAGCLLAELPVITIGAEINSFDRFIDSMPIQSWAERRDKGVAKLSQAERPAVLIAGIEHARKDHGVPFHLGKRASHLNIVAIALCGILLSVQESSPPTSLPFDFYWSVDSGE